MTNLEMYRFDTRLAMAISARKHIGWYDEYIEYQLAVVLSVLLEDNRRNIEHSYEVAAQFVTKQMFKGFSKKEINYIKLLGKYE